MGENPGEGGSPRLLDILQEADEAAVVGGIVLEVEEPDAAGQERLLGEAAGSNKSHGADQARVLARQLPQQAIQKPGLRRAREVPDGAVQVIDKPAAGRGTIHRGQRPALQLRARARARMRRRRLKVARGQAVARRLLQQETKQGGLARGGQAGDHRDAAGT